jgi:2-(1,2-epoxy-1,2-dihydrophenyl)acetyl-CoA isomerase
MEDVVEYRHILVDREDGVVTITFNEPRYLNPWLIPMMEELMVEIDRVKADPDDRVLVFTGAGDAFSAGGDVRAMGGVEYPEPHFMQYHGEHERGKLNVPTMTAEERLQGSNMSGTRIHKQIFYLDKPTIAAVNGVAAGAGVDLAFACDLRIASENARFIEVYIRRALFPYDGGAWWAPYLLPHAKAMELLLTGDALRADEALHFGLVNKVVPPSELMPTTMELARRLAKGPAVAIQLTKHMVRDIHMTEKASRFWGTKEEVLGGMKVKGLPITSETHDYKEAVQAFLDKRQPEFRGS